ncbi:MAG: MOSC domain-containing protein [Streptosporangiales bacterium]|nr:MOSC domain-containing protein [Streptosporangiales bacterium]
MHVTRLGLTPVKGMTHNALPELEVTRDGPVGDRSFCLVDRRTGAVMRTVGNEGVLACRANWRPPELTVETPIGTATGEVVDGELRSGDYWSRDVGLVTVEGPWNDLLRRYLGRDVVLCRVTGPADVVWAGSVSLVTTSSLADLAARTGRPTDDGVRFRATAVVDTGEAPAFTEDAWVGRRVRLGDVVIAVRGPLPRCAVVNRRPGTGERDVDALRALAPDRRGRGEIWFGLHADVETPGRVTVGDACEVLA